MGIFFVLLLVPIMMQHVAIKGHYINYQKRNKFALAFFFFLLTNLIMLRHESIGTDTKNYVYYFNYFSRLDWAKVGKSAVEIGFSYYNKIVSLFSSEPHFYLAITAIIVSVMMYPTYKRLCVDASLTIVLFCTMSTFVMMFSGMRQMLAIGLGFVAYDFTRGKKLIPFIVVVLLALFFHTSAFMLVFMYPLYHAKVTKRWLYAVVPALLVVFLFNKQIFAVLSLVLEHYTDYNASISSTGAYTMLILFAVFTVFSFIIPDESALDKETIGLRNFLLLVLVLQMFAPLHNLAMRMSYYYIIFIPLLLPKIISYRSARWSQVAIVARHTMVIVFLLYFFISAYTKDNNLDVFPYKFFWENAG